MAMKFEFTKLVGLLSMLGTIIGLVMGGATIEYNIFLAALFFLLAVVSFLVFVAFIYNFIMYAQYEMPAKNFEDDED